MRALILVIFSLFLSTQTTWASLAPVNTQSPSTADSYAASYMADALGELKSGQLKLKTVKGLRLNAAQSEIFKEFLPEITRLVNIALLDNTMLSFIKECQDTNVDDNSSSLKKELAQRISLYCHQRFLTNYFQGKNLTAMDNLRYDHLRKWMVYYLKGEAHASFLSLLKRLTRDSSIHREISFLITEQSISHKIYPSEEILSYIDVDRNLDLHVRRMAQTNLSAKKYLSDEFVRLGSMLSDTIDDKNKDEILDVVGQLEHFYTENREFIEAEAAWKTFLSCGRKLLLKDYDEQAYNLLSFATETGEADQKQEALFYQLLGHLLNKNPQKALSFVQRNNLERDFDTLGSKLKYWVAYTFEINNKSKQAETLYSQLVRSSPLTFYSIIGMKNLMKNNPKSRGDLIHEHFQEQVPTRLIALSSFSSSTQNNFARLSLWAGKRLEPLANFEIQDLQKLKLQTAKLSSGTYTDHELAHSVYQHMIRILVEKKRYLLTFKVASVGLEEGAIKTDKNLLGMLFPTELLPTVKRHSKLDPFLIMALIRQESAFNTEATSSVGARGLMQLLPQTAKKFKRGTNKKNLGNPAINIEVGSKYFNYLLKKFDGNLVFALAAYNAGEGRVSDWRKNIFVSDDPLLMIEAIPFKETRDYVKLIYRNLFYYKLLFDQFDSSSVEQSFKVSWNNLKK